MPDGIIVLQFATSWFVTTETTNPRITHSSAYTPFAWFKGGKVERAVAVAACWQAAQRQNPKSNT